MARPSKLTPEVQAQIVADIEAGNYAETAAQAAGIDPSTYHNWVKWGSQGQEPYRAFFEAVTRARAKAEVALVSAVKSGDEKGTSFGVARGAAFILERTRPRKFAARVKMQVADELNRALDIIQSVISPEDYVRVLEALDSEQAKEPTDDMPRDEEHCH